MKGIVLVIVHIFVTVAKLLGPGGAKAVVAAAENARSNEGLAHAVISEMRRQRIIVPAPLTVERLCADDLAFGSEGAQSSSTDTVSIRLIRRRFRTMRRRLKRSRSPPPYRSIMLR